MRRLLLALLHVFLITGLVHAGKIYQWTDDKGQLHFTDSEGNIPQKYRENTKPEGNVFATDADDSEGDKKNSNKRELRAKLKELEKEQYKLLLQLQKSAFGLASAIENFKKLKKQMKEHSEWYVELMEKAGRLGGKPYNKNYDNNYLEHGVEMRKLDRNIEETKKAIRQIIKNVEKHVGPKEAQQLEYDLKYVLW